MMTKNTLKETHDVTADSASDRLLNKGEAAARLRIGRRSVDNWMKRGWLPYIKLGKTVRFVWGDVLAKLNERRVN